MGAEMWLDDDIRTWMDLLPGGGSWRRVQTIQDLLVKANEDEMSVEDREICLRAITLLRADIAAGKVKEDRPVRRPVEEVDDEEVEQIIA
jgi:hypothetical protein